MDQSAISSLFPRHQQPLHRRLRWIVNTSEANIEDASAHAWLQLLSYRPELDDPLTWLTTVAVREAVKLERRSRRTRPLMRSDNGQELALVDRRLELELREELIDTAARLTAAGLSERQRRILGLLMPATATRRSPPAPATASAPSSGSSKRPEPPCANRAGGENPAAEAL